MTETETEQFHKRVSAGFTSGGIDRFRVLIHWDDVGRLDLTSGGIDRCRVELTGSRFGGENRRFDKIVL